MFKKRLLIIFILLFFFFGHQIRASEEFKIESTVTYLPSINVTMKVVQEVSLTNKLSQVYAKEYSFQIEGEAPTDISAWDDQGEIKYQLKSDPNSSTLILPFNREIVGKDKAIKFGLSYNKNDFIKKNGDVWEIIVPKFTSANEVDSLLVYLKVPLSFGQLAYISPNPASQSLEENSQVFKFDKNQLSNSGVVAAFGEFQTFDFELQYHLENDQVEKVQTEISLPPDTNYQKVFYKKIYPEPENVEIDKDGNWLAEYLLEPKQKLEIKAVGQAKIFAKPYRQFNKKEDLNAYLKPSDYWPVDDPLIQQAVENLKTPRQVYDFVTNYLKYDYSRVREGAKRLGAKQALIQPDRATCMEFTDLFVTLSRAAKIPAREINGFAYTTNSQLKPLSLVQDVLHSWPEYWDESSQSWIQVDPTWQFTTGGVDFFNKLDLGHFAFAIHGENSRYPPPAGSYKAQGEYGKDVKVEFGRFQETLPERVDLIFNLPKRIPSETKTKGQIIIKNLSGSALDNLSVDLKTSGLQLGTLEASKIEILLPFSSLTIPIELRGLGFFKTGPAEIVVKVNGQEFKQQIMVESFLLKGLVIFLFITGLSSILVYLILRFKRRKIDTQIKLC